METNTTKILRSVTVDLSPNELTKMVRDYLAKEGLEVLDVDFKVGSHLEGLGRGECLVYTFDGCSVKCRITTERVDT